MRIRASSCKNFKFLIAAPEKVMMLSIGVSLYVVNVYCIAATIAPGTRPHEDSPYVCLGAEAMTISMIGREDFAMFL